METRKKEMKRKNIANNPILIFAVSIDFTHFSLSCDSLIIKHQVIYLLGKCRNMVMQ